MLARLARSIGDRLALALALPREAAERAAYALENLFLFLLTFAAILAASAATGLLGPALAASLTGAAMRSLSGGAHFSSPWRCIFYSAFFAVVFGLAGRMLAPLLEVGAAGPIALTSVALLAMIVVFLYAPADTRAKPIPAAQGRVLKLASLAFILLWVLALAFIPLEEDLLGASLVGMIWQSLTISPIGYSLYYAMDGLMGKGGESHA